MGRKILAVIVSYVAMFVLLFLLFTAVYLILGTEGAFAPGSFYPSNQWLVASFLLGLVGAIFGGWLCKVIAKSKGAVWALAGVVVVIGLLSAIFLRPPAEAANAVRSGELSSMEAMMQARQPDWVHFVNPFWGAIGVLIGGSIGGKKDQPAA